MCHTSYAISTQFHADFMVNEAEKVRVLIDSASSGSFISPRAVKRLGLRVQQRNMAPLKVTHVQGGSVGQVTEQVECQLSLGDHFEWITLDVVDIGKHAIILGTPWLDVHDPTLRFGAVWGIFFDSNYCGASCQRNAETADFCEISAISVSEAAIVPTEYQDLRDVFDIEKARQYPPSRGDYDFKIDLKEGAKLPPPSKPYRLTPGQMEEMESQLRELEEAGMIEPSDSPMAAPLFFVPKKDGTQRMCIDYRKLNEITVRDAYPLPNMEALLELARGARVFSKFDLRSAYNMFRIRPEDKWKTAFVTPRGLFQFTVMHYGFVNAPACLQRYMDHILAPLIYKQPTQVTVYMDDIGSFALDTPDAVKVNREILKILGERKLYAKVSKCDFHKDEIELLGVTVNSQGFGLEDKKVMDVRNWPTPRNLKEMKGFIGFCNFYRRFIKNFSIMARPLHDLDKKGVPWVWEGRQQEAFDKIKDAILAEPCLAHVDPQKPFRLETDASDYAYGAALLQKQEDGKYHPVSFMSKSMLPAESNYDAYDREVIGIVKPLQHW